jgi:hypothetical protein
VLAAIRFGQCRIGFCGGATALGGFRRSGVRGWVRRKSRRRSGWLGGLHGFGDEVLRAGGFYPIAVFVDADVEARMIMSAASMGQLSADSRKLSRTRATWRLRR